MIEFEERDVVFDFDDSIATLKIKIPISIVMKRLKQKERTVKYSLPHLSKEEIEQEYFPRLSGVNFQYWISMNFDQSTSGKRSLNTYAKILKDLVELAEKYNIANLNNAMSKCNTPQRCTIPYLNAILRNQKINHKEFSNENINGKKYQRNIEEALKQFV